MAPLPLCEATAAGGGGIDPLMVRDIPRPGTRGHTVADRRRGRVFGRSGNALAYWRNVWGHLGFPVNGSATMISDGNRGPAHHDKVDGDRHPAGQNSSSGTPDRESPGPGAKGILVPRSILRVRDGRPGGCHLRTVPSIIVSTPSSRSTGKPVGEGSRRHGLNANQPCVPRGQRGRLRGDGVETCGGFTWGRRHGPVGVSRITERTPSARRLR